ncbi:L-rhamnose/proton symporter RhaT [Tamlana sp. 2_MG-2023]|uniref:L-rhamnose/proton symporter RhaT n=1 Tax=unclassified Tamlana TaxID=2614803 RepID=UPI0026E388DB|nr:MULTISPECIES: L-rhamnose/proton symporter RhaT [unclassified Tamlana]MDO6761324.1 L-rhamnose/proton symporter RhaT [Tamlana sp. 2_MG-2023]MDO6791807.1 L-rhamnose/proton symporter RhaT [Tamlana sp. 1_MG-2023]
MIGILLAVSAGIMLGFWAMPEKYIKNYAFENAWGLCYLFMLWIIPFIVAFTMIDNFGQVLADIGSPVLMRMLIPGFLWGVGMMLWGKAIDYIGLSLGFSLFIGTIICVGSMLPWFFHGVPEWNDLGTILLGIAIILCGIIFNGRAGMLRQEEENKSETLEKKSMVSGILIAVIGGVLATGFNVALEISVDGQAAKNIIGEMVVNNGNASWLSSVASMFIVYVSGGLFVIPYFIIMLTKKKLWGSFKVPGAGKNVSLTLLMAVLNFTASIIFAYSSFVLGELGGSIGYAIFNTLSVVVAVVAGIVTNEWVQAPKKAKTSLYLGLGSMIIGVLVTAFL